MQFQGQIQDPDRLRADTAVPALFAVLVGMDGSERRAFGDRAVSWIGQVVANLLLGLLAFMIVAVSGGPKWACVATAVIVYNVFAAADYIAGKVKNAD